MELFSRYRRIILVVLFIVLAAGIGFVIYLMFFRQALFPSQGGQQEQISTTTTGGQLPRAGVGTTTVTEGAGGRIQTTPIVEEIGSEVAIGGLTKTTTVSEASVLSPTLSSNGKNPQFYNKNDGKFYILDDNGNPEQISEKVFYNVENVTWSPVKSKAIIEYPDGANIVYDFNTQKQTTLPKHWEDFNFSNDGEKIIMKSIGLDIENRYLAVANNDGSSAKAIEYIGDNGDNVYPYWSPNNQMVAMYTEGLDFDRQEVYFLGLNEENFKSMVVEGRGFDPKWSTEGSKLLYSVYSTNSDLKPNLWIADAEGDNVGSNRHSINLETWASKCAFADNSTVYCAVPDYLEKGAGMFPELAQYSSDSLYKINLKTNSTELIAEPDRSYNMSNLSISSDGKNLYFSDVNTGKLEKIRIK